MILPENNHKFEFYLDKLKNNEHFSFTRWGDGEWLCLHDKSGGKNQNVDRHQFFPEMQKGMEKALKEDKGYFKACWPENHGQVGSISHIRVGYINNNWIQTEWVNATVWEDLVLISGIDKLVKQLESMDFIIVSEKSKRKLSVKYKDFIEVPSVNCFLDKDRIKDEVIKLCDKYENPVFGFSASMATNVIVDELYDEVGDRCWMIDFGSIWDPFVGNRLRSYHDEYWGKKLW